MFDNVVKFINYWYFRYLLVTELYMVERWERVMIHIVFLLIFMLISVFNTYLFLGIINGVFWMLGFFQTNIITENGIPALHSEL